jgi:hypothetical protein
MNAGSQTSDRYGKSVVVGDHIRILDVSPDPDLDEDDLEFFMEMIGSVSEVERIDETGHAWVTVWWATSEGSLTTTTALAPTQMERIQVL